MAYAGIDVGTSGCKMVVYNAYGKVLNSASCSYNQTGSDGYRELNPELVLAGVLDVITRAASESPEPIKCLAVCSMGESIICLDRDGNSLLPSMLTGDKRGISEAIALEKDISRQEVHQITGLPLSELYALPKWIWVHQNTDVFERTEHIFFYEDYVGWVLTGQRAVSYSSAARSMAFDIEKHCWSDKLLQFAGLTRDFFSTPVPSGMLIGKVLPETAHKLGLSEDTLVAVGGHDQSCCALGCGMVDESIGEDGQGTCEVMEFILPGKISSPAMLENGIACAPHVIPGKYLAQIELPNCGILMNWFRDNVFRDIFQACEQEHRSFFQEMDDRVKTREPGNLYVFPGFGSSGNPDVSNDARGTIWGLTVQTTPEEIFQGLKEGMAYQIYMAYLPLEEIGVKPSRIVVSGGGSKSDYTMQLRANVFGIPMSRFEDAQAGTLACAMLSMKACHPEMTYQQIIAQMLPVPEDFQMQPLLLDQYRKHYQRYRKLYDALLDYSNHPRSFQS